MEKKKNVIDVKSLLLVIILIALVGAVIYLATSGKSGVLTGNKSTTGDQKSQSDKYQAVFLTNGQVYFGKMKDEGGNYIKLTDIFYLQAKDQAVQPKDTSNKEPDLTLIKLGKELHAPADEMNISRQQVLFWEEIKDDGKVMQAIKEYKNTNK